MNSGLRCSSNLLAVGLSLGLLACSSGSADSNGFDAGGSGGGSGTGGRVGTGGTLGSGGVKGSGGNSGSGGVTASGGNQGSGGTTSSGGALGSGGATSSGGAPGSGGDRGTGGAQGSGGSNGSGGTSTSTGGKGAGGRRGQGGAKGSGGAAGSAGMKGSGGNSGGGGGSGSGASFADVLAIFQDRCVNCHDATKLGLPSYPQLSLTMNDAYDALVGHPADEACGGTRVVAGDPNASYIIQKVTAATPCEGAHMPAKFEVLPAVPLTAAQIATLKSWIAAGAKR